METKIASLLCDRVPQSSRTKLLKYTPASEMKNKQIRDFVIQFKLKTVMLSNLNMNTIIFLHIDINLVFLL